MVKIELRIKNNVFIYLREKSRPGLFILASRVWLSQTSLRMLSEILIYQTGTGSDFHQNFRIDVRRRPGRRCIVIHRRGVYCQHAVVPRGPGGIVGMTGRQVVWHIEFRRHVYYEIRQLVWAGTSRRHDDIAYRVPIGGVVGGDIELRGNPVVRSVVHRIRHKHHVCTVRRRLVVHHIIDERCLNRRSALDLLNAVDEIKGQVRGVPAVRGGSFDCSTLGHMVVDVDIVIGGQVWCGSCGSDFIGEVLRNRRRGGGEIRGYGVHGRDNHCQSDNCDRYCQKDW